MKRGMTPGRTGETIGAASLVETRLRGKTGRVFWRTLDELADTPAFRDLLQAEFPALAPAVSGIDRRAVLKVMGASLALAGLTGCSGEPDENALPYVEAPDGVVPGVPNWYATAVTMAGYAQPVLGKTYVGRPVKLEGNPDHPVQAGASDAFTQAALLGLYDPDRSRAPRRLGQPTSWADFDSAMFAQARTMEARKGEGFRLLTGLDTSPTLKAQIDALLRRWPQARWHVYEPLADQAQRDALRMVFGRPLDQHLQLDAAEAIVALDSDPLGPGPRQTFHARLWSQRRRAFQEGQGESLLFVAEPSPSLSGVMAHDRLAASPARIGNLLAALAGTFGVGAPQGSLSERERGWVDAAAAALDAHRNRSLLIVGDTQPAELQAVALLVNEKLGNFGRTMRFTEPIAIWPDNPAPLAALLEDAAAGRIATLAMLDVNPLYNAPADLDVRAALETVELRLHAGLYHDESAAFSHWHAPLAHDLESWSDTRAVDGTASIVQPLVRPFFSVRSRHSVLAAWAGAEVDADPHARVRETWRKEWGDQFDSRWTDALARGFVAESAPPDVMPDIVRSDVAVPSAEEANGPVAVIRPDPTIWDGRFASIAWLQELPKPISKATWGNVVAVGPALAAKLGIENGDEVRVEASGRAIVGPVWITPGQHEDVVGVTLGYGRSGFGGAADGLGYDAYRLRQSDRPWHVPVAITATGRREVIATTQPHHAMDGFDFVRTVSSAALRGEEPMPSWMERETGRTEQPTFYPVRDWPSPSWGMSIDLDVCIGCNACVAACVAENNIAMVGKDLVAEGREMHWLRVDHYYEGEPADPKMYFQPVPCMHCEHAPCEMGCPVNAAVHSSDGLNLQVYNRCIGTRTCSSFCPYKVRRFNWFDYTGDDPPPLRAVRNPEVTVRDRGVMEKCTYCVQRIEAARIEAKKQGREIRDGEVLTACQQACPTQAIVFGDVIDPDTQVSRRKAGVRDYFLLEEVNTRPRTSYLARIEQESGKKGETD